MITILDLYNMFISYRKKYGQSVLVMFGPFPHLFTSDVKLFEALLTSNVHIERSLTYKMLNVLGNGLLYAKGSYSTCEEKRNMITFCSFIFRHCLEVKQEVVESNISLCCLGKIYAYIQ